MARYSPTQAMARQTLRNFIMVSTFLEISLERLKVESEERLKE
jgi:hypothetical protein